MSADNTYLHSVIGPLIDVEFPFGLFLEINTHVL